MALFQLLMQSSWAVCEPIFKGTAFSHSLFASQHTPNVQADTLHQNSTPVSSPQWLSTVCKCSS